MAAGTLVGLVMPITLGLQTSHQLREDVADLDRSHDLQVQTRRIAATMLELESSQRSYLLPLEAPYTKDAAGREPVTAVRKVAAGGAYVTPGLVESFKLHLHRDATSPRHAKLSDREMEVLRRLVGGERLTDVAQALHLSVKTVSTHKGRILERLERPNLAALVRYGMKQGLVDEVAGRDDRPQAGF